MSMIAITIATTADVAQIATNQPNWVICAIIVAFIVIAGIIFLIPSKHAEIEDHDKSARKALPEDKKEESETKIESVDKDKMSLAEIKEAKRQSVSEEKSKEEMRKLRQERRATTQTQNAIHDREESEKQKAEEAAESDTKDTETPKSDAKESSKTENDAAVTTKTEAESKADKAESDSEAGNKSDKPEDDTKDNKADSNLLFASTSSGSDDIFADFFNNNDFDSDDASSSNDAIIPTLGSALIPLEAMRAAAEASDDSEMNLFDGFLSLNDSAEKKTPE